MGAKLRWILANMANATPAGNTSPQDPKGAFTAARSRAGRHRSVNQNSPPAEPHSNLREGYMCDACVKQSCASCHARVVHVSICRQGQDVISFCMTSQLCKDEQP